MFKFSTITDKSHLITVLILLQSLQSTSEPCGTRHDSTWPWHVQLVNTDPTHRIVHCYGTLLSDQLIITAAHCLHDRDGDPIELELLQVLLANGDLRSAMSTYYPKPYDPERLDHDVAMVALDRKITFSKLVGPACYADYRDFKNVRNPAFGNRTLPVQNEADCRQTTTKLFQITYEGAVCLGAFNQSHKYNQKTGSGLMIEYDSSWILVGVLMYTTGQSTVDQIEYAGGVRIERYYMWITRIINHYAEADLVNQKCKQYTSDPVSISNIWYSVHMMDVVNTLCHGVIISPRFVLTIAECAKKTKRIMVYPGQNIRNPETFVASKVYYDDWNNKLALIELDRNISSPGSVITCLWNEREMQNFTKTLSLRSGSLAEVYVSHVQYRQGYPLQVRYRCPANYQHTWFKTFGDLIRVKEAHELRPRIVGFLDGVPPCDAFDHFYNRQRTTEAINLQQYLPWIVDIVWSRGVASACSTCS